MAARASLDSANQMGGGRLWRALDVHPDEQPRVLWAGSMFFVVLAAASVGLTAADALFFLRNGVDTLPIMIMLSGLAVMFVTIGYTAGLSVVGPRTWSWMIMLVFAVWLGVERTAIAADTPGTYPAVWLTGQVVMYVGFTLLWDVAGELADARQAKRLFPLFTSAGIAGAVTGSALTGPLANLLGTENLLIVQAALLVLAGLLAKVTTARFLPHESGEKPNVIGDLKAGLQTTVRTPLFRLVAGVGAALSVLFFLVFFPFSEAAAASFETEEALAGFLGLFSSLATAATFLVSFLLVNRLFTRLGVVAVLMIVAVVYVAGFSMWLATFGLFTATLFRGVQWVAINALGGTAFNSLFNVLTGRTRSQVRDFVSAVPVQVGTVIAGAILLLGSDLSATARTVLSLGIALAFLALVIPMRRAYSAALVDAVRSGLSDVFTASLPGLQKPHHDADTLSALAAAVDDSSPGRRRVTAAILGDVGGASSLEALRKLLTDEDETVRFEAIGGLAKLNSETLANEALACLRDPSARVRRRAIALLNHEHAASPAVNAVLDDDDCEVRAHAARIVGGHRGRNVIEDMMADDNAAAVAAAMECVIAEPGLAPIDARPFAEHSDSRVRAMAARMLATRHDAVRTLTALLDDGSSEVRMAAAGALTRVDRSAVHDILEHGSVRARETALQSLVAEDEPDEYLHAWAASELDRATELRRWRVAIAARDDGASLAAEYLVEVLEKRERMVERWVVTALSTEETRAALPLIARGAISGDSEVKAEALEAIESIADRTLARRLSALLESQNTEPDQYRLQALQDLTTDHQYWFRALAARTIFEELVQDLETASTTAASDDSPVVRSAIPDHETLLKSNGKLTRIDAILALRQATIFEHLDPEDLEALAEVSEERKYAAGDIIFEQGSPGDEMMMIVTGSAVVRTATSEGDRTIAEPGPGEPVGDLGVLRSRPRMAEVVAGPAGVHSLFISGEAFLELLEEQPGMAMALMAKMAERIALTVDPTGAGGTAPLAV
jgi:HEAT repeat protein